LAERKPITDEALQRGHHLQGVPKWAVSAKNFSTEKGEGIGDNDPRPLGWNTSKVGTKRLRCRSFWRWIVRKSKAR